MLVGASVIRIIDAKQGHTFTALVRIQYQIQIPMAEEKASPQPAVRSVACDPLKSLQEVRSNEGGIPSLRDTVDSSFSLLSKIRS